MVFVLILIDKLEDGTVFDGNNNKQFLNVKALGGWNFYDSSEF